MVRLSYIYCGMSPQSEDRGDPIPAQSRQGVWRQSTVAAAGWESLPVKRIDVMRMRASGICCAHVFSGPLCTHSSQSCLHVHLKYAFSKILSVHIQPVFRPCVLEL